MKPLIEHHYRPYVRNHSTRPFALIKHFVDEYVLLFAHQHWPKLKPIMYTPVFFRAAIIFADQQWLLIFTILNPSEPPSSSTINHDYHYCWWISHCDRRKEGRHRAGGALGPSRTSTCWATADGETIVLRSEGQEERNLPQVGTGGQ